MFTGSPVETISPSSNGWMPAMHLISVDLPAPLSPTSAMTWRRATPKSTCRGLDRAEVLGDPAQLENRWVGQKSSPPKRATSPGRLRAPGPRDRES